MTNPMMYRVFLREEKDAPADKVALGYRASDAKILAWVHSEPSWKPTLEEQLKEAVGGSKIDVLSEKVDEHFVIIQDGFPIGIAHEKEELQNKMYLIAKKYAEEAATTLSSESGHKYIFIDVTSRGNKQLAEDNSKIIEEVSVPGELAHNVSTLRRIKTARFL